MLLILLCLLGYLVTVFLASLFLAYMNHPDKLTEGLCWAAWFWPISLAFVLLALLVFGVCAGPSELAEWVVANKIFPAKKPRAK